MKCRNISIREIMLLLLLFLFVSPTHFGWEEESKWAFTWAVNPAPFFIGQPDWILRLWLLQRLRLLQCSGSRISCPPLQCRSGSIWRRISSHTQLLRAPLVLEKRGICSGGGGTCIICCRSMGQRRRRRLASVEVKTKDRYFSLRERIH